MIIRSQLRQVHTRGPTLACWLPVGPLLNLHVVSRPSDDVLVLKGGVGWDVERVPVLYQRDLGAVLGLLVDLKQHHALVQVDVLKKPGEKREKTSDMRFLILRIYLTSLFSNVFL